MLDLLHFLAHWSLCHHIPFNSITEYFKNIFKKPYLIRTKICRIFEGQSWKQIIVVGKIISLPSLILRLLSSNEFFSLFPRSTSRGCQLLCTAECYLICDTIRSHHSPLSNVWWIRNSVSIGFDTAMKTDSRRFKRYPTTYRWVSSRLPFTVD